MSGNAKHKIYQVVSAICTVGAYLVSFLLLFMRGLSWGEMAVIAFLIVVFGVFFGFSVIIHELGHFCFGRVFGMKLSSITVGSLSFSALKKRFSWKFSSACGHTEMFPTNPYNVRRKMFAMTVGGAVFNLIYGVLFMIFFYILPNHLLLTVFELLAPISIMEGLLALYPIELLAGKTDGAFLLGLFKRENDEEIALRVAQAQAILYHGRFSDIPQDILFQTPVVRADLAAFLSLSLLQMQYANYCGTYEIALEKFARIEEIFEDLPRDVQAQFISEQAIALTLSGERVSLSDNAFFDGVEENVSTFLARTAMEMPVNLQVFKTLMVNEHFRGIRDYAQTIFERISEEVV